MKKFLSVLCLMVLLAAPLVACAPDNDEPEAMDTTEGTMTSDMDEGMGTMEEDMDTSMDTSMDEGMDTMDTSMDDGMDDMAEPPAAE